MTSDGKKVRVAVCDDHGLFRRGVAEMLSVAEDVEVVGEASTHDEAVAIASQLSPDVVLLDLEMPSGQMGPMSRWRACSRSPRPQGWWFSRCTTSLG